MNQLIQRLYSRAAMTLALMERRAATALFLIVLTMTAQTAWAEDITFRPAVKKSYMFTGKNIWPQIVLVICNGEEYNVVDSPQNSGDCAVVRYGENILNGTGNGSIYCKLYHNGEVVLDDWKVTFDILPREVTLVVDDCEKYYGDADPAFTCHFDPSTTAEVKEDTVNDWNRNLPKAYRHVEMTREAGESLGTYTINSTRTLPFEFLTPAMRVTAIVPGTMTVKPNPADFSVNEAGTEYTIHTATGWDVFCDALLDNDTYNRFSGKTVKLGANIGTAQDPITRMAGSGDNPFCGNFDGGNHTLTFTATAADNYCAPFVGVKGGTTADDATTISNLNVVTTITANDYRHTAGLIALQWGHVNVSGINATVNISSTVGTSNPHDLYPAALVSQASSSNGGTLTVTGCTASGTISTDGKYAAGLVGIVQGTASISDCVSSVTIDSSTSGDGTHGGIVAVVTGSGSIEGCVFNGKLLSKNTGNDATTNCAGFVAWGNGTISNCLYAPANIDTEHGETEVLTGDVNNYPSGTFYRGTAPTVSNCYYTRTLGTVQGKAPRTVTAGTDVILYSPGPLNITNTYYNVSGIRVYTTGGLYYNHNLYYGSGDRLSILLDNTRDDEPLGYRYTYAFSGGTADEYEYSADYGETSYHLTMPDQDVTVNVDTETLRSTGQAVTVGYVDENGIEQTANAVALDGSETSRAAGTYFVGAPTVSFDHTLTLTGDVTLILEDNCTMEANGGIVVSSGNSLTIYAQSDGGSMGVLIAKVRTSDDYSAGIGGSNGQSCGTVTINGGDITAKGGDNGAGIGGGAGGSGGTIVINGGSVKAYGNSTSDNLGGGAGIGGGTGGAAGDITINGGTVTARGNWYVPGIGGGINGTGGNITINGGKVTAEGGYDGDNGINGTIILSWTNATDRIYASSYRGTLAVASGKAFVTDDATPSVVSGTLADGAIDGKTLSPCLQLADDADNGATIGGFSGKAIAVQLQGRKLWKDGDWNTLCLPFSVALAGSPLQGADARQLTEASISGTTLNLTFSDKNAVTTIEAGRPYIIKWERADDYADDDAHNIVSPVFSGVTVSSTMQPYDTDAVNSDTDPDNDVLTDERVRFIGTYKGTMFQAEDKSILLMGAGNQLFYPQPSGGQNPSLGAQRAYFKIGEDGSQQARQLTGFNITFDGEATTGIVSTTNFSNFTNFMNGDDAWYSLDGRKLQGKPTKRGVYLNNGKKVVVK